MGYTVNDVKDLAQLRSDDQTVEFKRDPDIRLAQGRDIQQGKALPCLIGAEEVAMRNLEDRS